MHDSKGDENMENKISCPHCGLEYDGLDYIEVGDMEGSFEMDCEGCEKEFTVSFTTTIHFEVKK